MEGGSLWMCLWVFLRLCFGVAGKEHTHYIAVEEIDWDYAPDGDLTGYGPRRPRTTYRKAVYREYTDASFTVRKPHPPEMGLLGPTMAATYGDVMHVHFKNMASRPFSLHVSSAIYKDESNTKYTSKANEGAKYGSLFTSLDLPTDADMDADDEVPPGGMHLYKWALQVDDRPGIEDDLCVSSVYYSHSQELIGEVNSGPVGVLLSCYNDGDLIRDYTGDRIEGIKRSYILLVQTIDETKSRYAKDNGLTSQDSGKHTFHAINGYVDGNLPGLDICSGDAVLWYVVSMGTTVDVHSLMFNGHAISSLARRTTALPLMAGSQVAGRMVGQEPGRWLIRDAFDEHFLGGATAFFNVLTCENKTLNSKKDKVKDDAPVRKYYIAAEEVDWDYAPSGDDKVGTGGR